jgi:hypothetical protein
MTQARRIIPRGAGFELRKHWCQARDEAGCRQYTNGSKSTRHDSNMSVTEKPSTHPQHWPTSIAHRAMPALHNEEIGFAED